MRVADGARSDLHSERPELAAAVDLNQILRCARLAVVDRQVLICYVILLDFLSASVNGIGQLLQSWATILCVVPAE